MTLAELISRLEEMEEKYGSDAEVLIANQPSWPLAVEVAAITPLKDSDDEVTIWIATGDHPGDGRSPYAPSEAWEGGW